MNGIYEYNANLSSLLSIIANCGTDHHRDGNGVVDSGHLNLHGFNEVVILRRLPEHHLERAMKLSGGCLYQLPHDRKKSNKWPTTTIIQQLKELKYEPLSCYLCYLVVTV